jgi:hypothetical protein
LLALVELLDRGARRLALIVEHGAFVVGSDESFLVVGLLREAMTQPVIHGEVERYAVDPHAWTGARHPVRRADRL